jgi:hypothetical protein
VAGDRLERDRSVGQFPKRPRIPSFRPQRKRPSKRLNGTVHSDSSRGIRSPPHIGKLMTEAIARKLMSSQKLSKLLNLLA